MWRLNGILFTARAGALLVLGLLAGGPPAAAGGEDEDPTTRYRRESLEQKPFDREAWRRAVDGLNYNRRARQRDKQEKEAPVIDGETLESPSASNSSTWKLDSPFWQFMLRLLLYMGVAALLFFLFRLLYTLFWTPRNRRVAVSTLSETVLKSIENRLPEVPLDRYIEEALAAGDYPLALRLHYLLALQTLHRGGWIRWKKEKTNREYIRELKGARLRDDFARLTRVFELVWYGESPFPESAYRRVAPAFRQFIDQAAAKRDLVTSPEDLAQ
jgi:hypothetical protein